MSHSQCPILGSYKYLQVAVVHGGLGECGNNEFPGIYVRLEIQKYFTSSGKLQTLLKLTTQTRKRKQQSHVIVFLRHINIHPKDC